MTTTTTIEALIYPRSRVHYAPSPAVLKSEAAGVDIYFDRNAPDAERVLNKVFKAHAKASPGFWEADIPAWVEWCMDRPQTKAGARICKRAHDGDRKRVFDWGATFEGC
ncbi:MAG: hypothetical protein AAF871_13110 [Pseudomonadota bacterium]